MRFLRLSTAYERYLQDFYEARPGLASSDYEEQLRQIHFDGFGWHDVWPYYLKAHGYEGREVIANALHLQNGWARERGLKGLAPLDIAAEQVIEFNPEILFVTDHHTFKRDWLLALKEKCPALRLVVGWCGAPYPDFQVFKAYDVTLSCIPEVVEHLRGAGFRAEHMNHGFDPRILNRIDMTRKKSLGFTFTGQVIRNNRYHLEREKLLAALASNVEMRFFCPIESPSFKRQLIEWIKVGLYHFCSLAKRLGVSEEVIAGLPPLKNLARLKSVPQRMNSLKWAKRIEPAVFGLAMFQTLQDSLVTFNSHIDLSAQSASNMRLFEATGVGTCLLSDYKENMSKLFSDGDEVVTYRNADECIEKVRWLLAHPDEARKIGVAGQKRALRDHSFVQRAEAFHEIIQRYLLCGNVRSHEARSALR